MTSDDLKACEEELRATSADSADAPLDVFVVRLHIWQQHESQRLLAKEWYGLTADLKGENERWVKAYAEAKRALVALEDKMLDILKALPADVQAMALTGSFASPGLGVVNCSSSLASRLRAGLKENAVAP